MNIDLTPIFQAIISLIAALVAYKLIPWIKQRTTNEQQLALQTATRIAVFAAEQLIGAGKGKEKLDYVKTYLMSKGYRVDLDLIEATVRELSIEQS